MTIWGFIALIVFLLAFFITLVCCGCCYVRKCGCFKDKGTMVETEQPNASRDVAVTPAVAVAPTTTVELNA